jgi:hypothetical protein
MQYYTNKSCRDYDNKQYSTSYCNRWHDNNLFSLRLMPNWGPIILLLIFLSVTSQVMNANAQVPLIPHQAQQSTANQHDITKIIGDLSTNSTNTKIVDGSSSSPISSHFGAFQNKSSLSISAKSYGRENQSSTIYLTSGNHSVSDPQVTANRSNVYAVWMDRSVGNGDIFFARSTDNGTNFYQPVNLSHNPANSFGPQIASFGGNVYVAWSDFSNGNSDIFLAASTNRGANFGTTIDVSNDPGNSEVPHIAAYANNVYVAWSDNTPGKSSVYFAKSDNDGKSFDKPIKVNTGLGEARSPELSVSLGIVHLVWDDASYGNDEIFYSHSVDAGNTFSVPRNLSNNSGYSVGPMLSTSGNNVYVVWSDRSPGDNEVFFANSIDGGNTFNKSINLTNEMGCKYPCRVGFGGRSISPQISATTDSRPRVYVVWNDLTNSKSDIIIGKYIGGPFSTPAAEGKTNNSRVFNFTDLTNGTLFSSEPKIFASEKNVNIVFNSFINRNTEVFFTSSNDSGNHFGKLVNISNSLQDSVEQQITSYGNRSFIVWVEVPSGTSGLSFLAR